MKPRKPMVCKGYACWVACWVRAATASGGRGAAKQLVAVCVKGGCGEEKQGENTALGENQSAECAACEAGRGWVGGACSAPPSPPRPSKG